MLSPSPFILCRAIPSCKSQSSSLLQRLGPTTIVWRISSRPFLTSRTPLWQREPAPWMLRMDPFTTEALERCLSIRSTMMQWHTTIPASTLPITIISQSTTTDQPIWTDIRDPSLPPRTTPAHTAIPTPNRFLITVTTRMKTMTCLLTTIDQATFYNHSVF